MLLLFTSMAEIYNISGSSHLDGLSLIAVYFLQQLNFVAEIK